MGNCVWVYEILPRICNATSTFCIFFFLYADNLTNASLEHEQKEKDPIQQTYSRTLHCLFFSRASSHGRLGFLCDYLVRTYHNLPFAFII